MSILSKSSHFICAFILAVFVFFVNLRCNTLNPIFMSKKILMLAGDFVEDYEIMVPFQALLSVGCEVDVVCPGKKKGEIIATAIHDFVGFQTYAELRGHNFQINKNFDDVQLNDYNGLYVCGG